MATSPTLFLGVASSLTSASPAHTCPSVCATSCSFTCLASSQHPGLGHTTCRRYSPRSHKSTYSVLSKPYHNLTSRLYVLFKLVPSTFRIWNGVCYVTWDNLDLGSTDRPDSASHMSETIVYAVPGPWKLSSSFVCLPLLCVQDWSVFIADCILRSQKTDRDSSDPCSGFDP